MYSDNAEVICGSKDDIKKFVQWVDAYEGNRPPMYTSTERPDILSSYYSSGDMPAHRLLEDYLKHNDGSFAYSSQSPVGSSVVFTRMESKNGFMSNARVACNTEFEGFGQVDIKNNDMTAALREFSQLSVLDVDKMSGDLGGFLYDKLPQQRQSVDMSTVNSTFDEYADFGYSSEDCFS